MMRKPCSQPSKAKSHSQVPSWAHTQCCLCCRSLLFSPKHSEIEIALSSFLLETIIIIVITTTIIIIIMTIMTINKITKYLLDIRPLLPFAEHPAEGQVVFRVCQHPGVDNYLKMITKVVIMITKITQQSHDNVESALNHDDD